MDSKVIYRLMVKKCPNTRRNKHYLKRYVKFIAACVEYNQSLPEDTYTEKHHILPKAKNFWPEYTNLNLFEWNLANLTKRQHYMAHWMLCRSYGGGMWFALQFMIIPEDLTQNEINSKRPYTGWNSNESQYKSKATLMKNYGVDNPFQSKEIQLRIKTTLESKYGVDNPSKSKDVKNKKIQTTIKNYGVAHHNQLDYNRERLSTTMKNTMKNIPHYECPYCSKEIKGLTNFNKWHNENCKSNPNRSPILHTCSKCGFESENKGMISRFHNEKCRR